MKIVSGLELLWYRARLPLWALILMPTVWCYRLGFNIHRFWKKRTAPQKKPTVPIIVVGNLIVGGAGKTPIVIALANALTSRGRRVGVITRGYKRRYHKPILLNKQTQFDVTLAGDEPVLIAEKTRCPVCISSDRNQAIDILIKKTDVDVIISDDGLQHHALSPTIQMVAVDERRGFGNYCCLPLGPLREPIHKLKEVDVILRKRRAAGIQMVLPVPKEKISDVAIESMGYVYSLNEPTHTRSIESFKTQKVHAVAGIADPEKFFQLLRRYEIAFIPHVFSNHHPYEIKDLRFSSNHPILMTEKDAVKCRAFQSLTIWCVPIQAQLEPVLIETVLKKIGTQHHARQ